MAKWGAQFRLLAVLASTIFSTAYYSTASLAATPADLCTRIATDIRISDADINEAIARATKSAKSTDQSDPDDVLAKLEVVPSDAAPASTASRAAYCELAGTAMRLAKSGSPLQAQTYLLTAFGLAEQSDKRETSSRAAFQLGLNGTVGGGSGFARGAQRGRARSVLTEASPAAVPLSRTAGELPCKQLSAPSSQRSSGSVLMVAALQCASIRAEGVGDFQTAAVSKLKLARHALSLANTSASRERLDELATLWASEGLQLAGKIANDWARIEVSERLVDALAVATHGKPGLIETAETAKLSAGPMPIDPATQAAKEGLAARLALLNGDRIAAAAGARRAMFFESQRSVASRMADWLLLLAAADQDHRAEHLTEAYNALEAVRPFLPLVDPLIYETNFTLRMKPVFEQVVEMQLSVDNVEDLQIAQSQHIIEAYRQAEVESLLGDNCLPANAPLQPGELRFDEMILYPIVLSHRVELLFASGASDGSGQSRYQRVASIPIERSAVAELVKQLINNTTLTNFDVSETVRTTAARKLYNLLIAPVAHRISPTTTLVIIPDGMLRGIPFASLIDDKGQYLIQDVRIAIAPALAYSQPGSDRSGTDDVVLAASLQREMKTPFGLFPQLDGVATEARAVVDISGRRATHLSDFGKEDLLTALSQGRLDILHLATHASFNGGSERSFILTGTGVLSLPELRQMLVRNRQRGAEIDLLVLSACETAVGDDQASMGLAGAAVQAGAKSALASLWQVSDLGTTELMKDFYTQFRSGASKSEALRNAQISLIQQGGDNADPGIWAAFVLLGGWR